MAAYAIIIFILFFLRFIVFNKEIMIGKEKRNFIILALTPATLVSGFRNEKIGADTASYKSLIADLSKYNSNVDDRIEKGFVYLSKIIANFTSEGQWLIIIVAVFLSVCIGIFVYKNAKDPFLAILFFITLGLYQFSLTGIRQTIAIGITLLAMELIKNRKFLLFLIAIYIASTFHKTAFLFIPAYFIANRDLSFKNLLLYGVISLIIIASGEYMILKAATILDYKYGIEETGTGKIFFGIVLIISYYGFRYKNRIINQNNYNVTFLNINIISFLLWGLRMISRTAERVTFYYMPSTYLVLEELISSIKSKQKKYFIYFIVSGLSVALFFYRLQGNEHYVPYRIF